MSYEGGPMNRLVGLLVICPDRHDSYLWGYAQTDGTLPWRQEIGASSTIVYLTMSYLEWLLLIKNITEVLYSLLFSLIIFRALMNCLIARASSYSGTSNAQINNEKRCSANNSNGFHIYLSIQPFALRFFGHGTFGWTATRVHEKIVTRQL